jgi:hypothetical protein
MAVIEEQLCDQRKPYHAVLRFRLRCKTRRREEKSHSLLPYRNIRRSRRSILSPPTTTT